MIKWGINGRSESNDDMIIDYRTFETVRANEAKLEIIGWPEKIKPAVMNISIFGYWSKKEN